MQRVVVAQHQQSLVARLEANVPNHFPVLVEPRQELDGHLVGRTREAIRRCFGVGMSGWEFVGGVTQEEVIVVVDQAQELTGRGLRGGLEINK